LTSRFSVTASGLLCAGLLEERARREPIPDDWAYVFNFDEPDCPQAIRLPGGHGSRLRAAVERILDPLCLDLPQALKAKDFSAERERLGQSFGKRSEQLFEELQEHARRLGLLVQRQPNGMLNLIALKDNRPMEAADFEKLSDAERSDLQHRQEELGEHIVQHMARQQDLMREMHGAVEEIVRSFARRILDPLFSATKVEFTDKPVGDWLDRVRDHLLGNLDRLNEPKPDTANPFAAVKRKDRWLECRINVVADHARAQGAPLLVELSPSYKNLVGTIVHDVKLFGRVTTDFTRIKAGSALRASGGYLILDLADALTEPLVWKQRKRVLGSGQLLTETYDPMALFTAAALRPEPIPIDTKVVVLGSAELFYLLRSVDEDFVELFKIQADFGDEAPRDGSGERAYARFVAKRARDDRLPPFDAAAVAEVIRFGARKPGHRDKLSVDLGALADLVLEAGHWAHICEDSTVGEAHVPRALEERVYRSERIAAKIRELILEGSLRVALEGRRVGEVNGLPVLYLGESGFGWPSRLSASVGIGKEGVVNIESEAELSGNIFDK
jgi:predicted ATP-dependent protease